VQHQRVDVHGRARFTRTAHVGRRLRVRVTREYGILTRSQQITMGRQRRLVETRRRFDAARRRNVVLRQGGTMLKQRGKKNTTLLTLIRYTVQ
jgi:hypothetical protein